MFNMEKHIFKSFYFNCLIVFAMLGIPSVLYATGEPNGLYTESRFNSAIEFDFYPSGYSDGWFWGKSDRHHNWNGGDPMYGDAHEMLSGEWVAAIYYDGIHDNRTQWLTNQFVYPDWQTYTSFYQDPNIQVWDNYRAARSDVNDPNVKVTIDYKLVDIGDSNYVVLPFRKIGGALADVNSERYILIQTYTIKNTHSVGGSDITGLEFYQMLHGHPTGTDDAIVNSTYSDVNYPDTLKDPCDPAKTFRYAITQWNSGNPNTEHVDWVSFGSTVQPDWFDNGSYKGHIPGEPISGTHKRIENRALNGAAWIYYDEAAGAMGYKLGTLTPGQSTSTLYLTMTSII